MGSLRLCLLAAVRLIAVSLFAPACFSSVVRRNVGRTVVRRTADTGFVALGLLVGVLGSGISWGETAHAEPRSSEAAVQIAFVAAGGRQQSHLPLASGLPPPLRSEASAGPGPAPSGEFRVLVVVARALGEAPQVIDLASFDGKGQPLDSSSRLVLREIACPGEFRGQFCFSTEPQWLVSSKLDRGHPVLRDRTLLGVLGGSVVAATPEVQATLPVLPSSFSAPAAGSPKAEDPIALRVRTHVVGVGLLGTDALGRSAGESDGQVADALTEAVSAFAQCGVVLSNDEAKASFDVVSEASLLTVGCGDGLSATGGSISLTTPRGAVLVSTSPGQSPLFISAALRGALEERGYVVRVYRNAQTALAAGSSFDLVVTEPSGQRVDLAAPPGRPLSTDPSLQVCLARPDFGDGVAHFGDLNSSAGTLEERTLIRALADDDPRTMEVIIVPEFGGSGRIGESFIFSEGASIENVLLLDRSGIRALPRSMTLAHEMGHILLHLPGHPDDFGVDQPSHLMDADASDATVFGPRRLEPADCQRLWAESGPSAVVPLLSRTPVSGLVERPVVRDAELIENFER